jgi:hypothetical protein
MAQVYLKAVGSAPPLPPHRVHLRVPDDWKFEQLRRKVKELLGLQPGTPLLLYVNASFMPGPTDSVAQACRLFGSTKGTQDGSDADGPTLNVSYSLTPAWG